MQVRCWKGAGEWDVGADWVHTGLRGGASEMRYATGRGWVVRECTV